MLQGFRRSAVASALHTQSYKQLHRARAPSIAARDIDAGSGAVQCRPRMWLQVNPRRQTPALSRHVYTYLPLTSLRLWRPPCCTIHLMDIHRARRLRTTSVYLYVRTWLMRFAGYGHHSIACWTALVDPRTSPSNRLLPAT